MPYKSNRKLTLNDYPEYLQGVPQYGYGGHQTRRLKTYGGKFGPASPVKIFTEAERLAWQRENEK